MSKWIYPRNHEYHILLTFIRWQSDLKYGSTISFIRTFYGNNRYGAEQILVKASSVVLCALATLRFSTKFPWAGEPTCCNHLLTKPHTCEDGYNTFSVKEKGLRIIVSSSKCNMLSTLHIAGHNLFVVAGQLEAFHLWALVKHWFYLINIDSITMLMSVVWSGLNPVQFPIKVGA